MRKAKVLVSDLSSKGKKIFHSGDEVNETNFHPGSFDKLITGKYIKEIVSEPQISAGIPATAAEPEMSGKENKSDEELDESKKKEEGASEDLDEIIGGKKKDEEVSSENSSEKVDENLGDNSFVKNTKTNRKK